MRVIVERVAVERMMVRAAREVRTAEVVMMGTAEVAAAEITTTEVVVVAAAEAPHAVMVGAAEAMVPAAMMPAAAVMPASAAMTVRGPHGRNRSERGNERDDTTSDDLQPTHGHVPLNWSSEQGEASLRLSRGRVQV